MPDATFLTDIEIRDTDLCTETARQWQADFVQLDQGPFRAAIKQICFNGTQLGECSLSRRLHQHGIDFFHMDALSSAVALKVNCDLQLTIMAFRPAPPPISAR